MRKISFLLILLLLVGCSTIKVQQSPYKQTGVQDKPSITTTVAEQELHLVGLGDSLTQGVGDEVELGYLGRVEERLEQQYGKDISIANFGKKGDKTTNLLKKLNNETVQKEIERADLIFLTIGANDIMKIVRQNIFSLTYEPFEEEQKNFETRFEEIIQVIRTHNPSAPIYYVGLYNPFFLAFPDFPEINLIIEQWNESAEHILSKDNNATFISVQQIFENEEEPLLSQDHFHPNENGYSMIAEQVYQALIEDRKM